MNRRVMPVVVLALVLAVAGCGTTGSSSPSSTTPPNSASSTSPASPSSRTAPDGRPFVTEEVATYSEPWAMSFLPGTNQLLVTQQSGELFLRDLHTGLQLKVTGVPEVVFAGQGGLGDVVPSPTFAKDRIVYLSWAEAGDAGTSGAVIGRARLEVDGSNARLVDLKIIWRQTPKVTGNGHYSHRMAFSPDGKYLFVSSGERQKFDPAQDLSVNLGKVLRLNSDGTPAAGNPFADRGGVSAQIWSYGHRNVLGLAFDPSGHLWGAEMGPKGGDELNLIVRGRNYGWPKASNGSHYSGEPIPDHRSGDGFEAPKVWWNPSVSPGSLMIYTGDQFPQWKGDAFIGALSGQALIRVDLDGTSARKADEWDLKQRIRAVAQAPDGSILILEDAPGGRLLRLTPA